MRLSRQEGRIGVGGTARRQIDIGEQSNLNTPMKHTSYGPDWWLLLAVAAIGASGPIQAASPIPGLETKDKVQARVGVFRNGSGFTAPGGGHTGQAGDYAVDFRTGSGPVVVEDGGFLNEASA